MGELGDVLEGVKRMMRERLEMAHRVLDAFIGGVAGVLEESLGREGKESEEDMVDVVDDENEGEDMTMSG